MTEREYRHIINRQYRLPWQIERARDRLVQLEAERAWSAFNADDRVIRSPRYSRLAAMISAQRRRIDALEAEARRYAMPELLTSLDDAWERTVALAKAGAE